MNIWTNQVLMINFVINLIIGLMILRYALFLKENQPKPKINNIINIIIAINTLSFITFVFVGICGVIYFILLGLNIVTMCFIEHWDQKYMPQNTCPAEPPLTSFEWDPKDSEHN